MKLGQISIVDLSKKLDVPVPQIYKWNREGISINCKHYLKLKKMFPDLEPKEILLTKQGKEDERYKAGRKKKDAIPLTDTFPKYREPKHNSTLFPTIYINNKTT